MGDRKDYAIIYGGKKTTKVRAIIVTVIMLLLCLAIVVMMKFNKMIALLLVIPTMLLLIYLLRIYPFGVSEATMLTKRGERYLKHNYTNNNTVNIYRIDNEYSNTDNERKRQ